LLNGAEIFTDVSRALIPAGTSGSGGSTTTPPGSKPGSEVLGASVTNPGYRIVTFTGQVFSYGAADDYGSASTYGVVDLASSPGGYWLVTFTGKVLPFGTAEHFGDLSSTKTPSPVVAMAATPSGKGYWL